MKNQKCRFYRTSEIAWGELVSSVNGIAVFITSPKFKIYTLSKARGGYGLVFDGRPKVKTINAARLMLLGKGEKRFILYVHWFDVLFLVVCALFALWVSRIEGKG